MLTFDKKQDPMEVKERALQKLGVASLNTARATRFPFQNGVGKTYAEVELFITANLGVQLTEELLFRKNKPRFKITLYKPSLIHLVNTDDDREEGYKRTIRRCFLLLKRLHKSRNQKSSL